MTTFEEAVNLIKGIEAQAQESEEFTIDPNSLESTIEVKSVPYEQVMSQLGFAERHEAKEQKPKAEEAQVRVQKTEQVQEVPVKVQRKPQAHVFEKELGQAASKLESIAKVNKSVERKLQEQKERKQMKGLVLPTLSINDQLSDLEKINEGLDEGVFNEEQLEIIRLEANGLARLIAEGKQANAPSDLAELRNRLLKEIIDKVGQNVS